MLLLVLTPFYLFKFFFFSFLDDPTSLALSSHRSTIPRASSGTACIVCLPSTPMIQTGHLLWHSSSSRRDALAESILYAKMTSNSEKSNDKTHWKIVDSPVEYTDIIYIMWSFVFMYIHSEQRLKTYFSNEFHTASSVKETLRKCFTWNVIKYVLLVIFLHFCS